MTIQSFDIAEVARRTGLSSRALRFYEARGLVIPLRSASGRRHYGVGELERLHRLVALKRAGLSLADIKRLFENRAIDLRGMLEVQIAAIEEQAGKLADAKALLQSALSRIDRGEPVDAETFCSLIRKGDVQMESESWKKVTDRYFSPEDQAHWAERMKDVPGGFDPMAYNARWEALGAKIEAALPLDPGSPKAGALYDEWQALLAPFTAVATTEMMAGATNLYNRMDEWQGDRKPPFPMTVWNFIQSVGATRKG